MESKEFANSRNAAEITLNKIGSYDELNALTEKEGDERFSRKTRELWKEFAVSGVMAYDEESGGRKLQPYTDLDGRTTIELLEKAGIDASDIKYIKPGTVEEGRINFDTGDKLGVSYDKETDTAIFDHHTSENKTITSSAEIMYNVLADLKLLERSESLDRTVDFVTKMDNRLIPQAEFLRSGKTIIGVQRHLDFNKLLSYFTKHESPLDELTPEEFEDYGLREVAENQQKIVDDAMKKMESMASEGKVVETEYGKILINEGNELRVGASAAYVKYDGIVNFTPDKSFAVTLKEKNIDSEKIREKLGDKFQGKIIREKMWIYNDQEPLKIDLTELIECLK
ncbi:MAG: hypothetical protein Q7S53_01695 [bacterium]|nr:hypothetical protein [bacterium]